jgi:eukaryotic-like serine/threonine-protein kinase
MNEESLFAAALDLAGPSERKAYLDAACGDDMRLRSRLDQLLAAGAHCDGILDRPPPIEPPVIGRVFAGRFKLRQKLGEGGMGEVWVADQTEPVQRRVAIKMIRAGIGSASLLARFDQERQALALMDHPNVAKVLDAGVDGSQPYFVMDLIKGVPITEYCDAAKLSPRQRLELFVPVCHAVQHAHQKGIIHRDLKPSNILIALFDGQPVPKVIDFGVAKATGPRISAASVYTEVGALIGTVEYMSPEQAEMNNLDVDTRSDVYALGVLLYELLTGTVPFPRHQLQAATFVEMLRIIKEDDPPRPSTRLSSTETLVDVAAVRRTAPGKLASVVRGDLDWIVMKCLDKDRSRRYQTANGLADDLQRYLADATVLAGPPRTWYRLRKTVRRNRGPVLAAALLLLALVGGMIGTTIGLVRAERARAAESQRAEGERSAKELSQKRLEQIERSIDLVLLVFADLNPRAEGKEGKPLRAILGERLVAVAGALDGEAIADPLLIAKLQNRLGQALLNLGVPGRAVPLFEKSLTTRTALLGPDDPETLDSMNNLARGYHQDGKINRAMPLYMETLRLRRRTQGDDHVDTLTSANNLASGYRAIGRADQALPLLQETLRRRQLTLGPNDRETLTSANNLAIGYQDLGMTDLALALYRETLDRRRTHLGPTHSDTLQSMGNLAALYSQLTQPEKALPLEEERLRLTRAELGPRHTETLFAMNNLAATYLQAKLPDKAFALYEETLALRRAVLGPGHHDTLNTLYYTGTAYVSQGKPQHALPYYREAAAGVEKLQFQHRNAAQIVPELSRCLEELKQFDEAEIWRRKWLAPAQALDTGTNPAYAKALERLGSNLFKQAKYADAEPILLQSEHELKNPKTEGPINPTRKALLLQVLVRLADCAERLGRTAESARWRQELEEIKSDHKAQ